MTRTARNASPAARGLALGLAGLGLALGLPRLAGARQDAETHLVGVLQPSEVLSVSAAVDGLLEEVRFDVGDVVPAGAVVARLSGDVERASAALFRARTENEAQLAMAEAELASASRNLEQRERLAQQGIVSADEYEDARVELSLRQLAVEDARAQSRLSLLELARAEAQVRQLEVTCPVEGVVVARHLSAGELLSRSGAPAVLEVVQLDPLQVDLRVPLDRWGDFAPGDVARVRAALPGAAWRTATVRVVRPVADAASGTFVVRLEVPNPEHAWPAGVRAEVELP